MATSGRVNTSEIAYINGLRKTCDYLYDGHPPVLSILLYIKQNYKRWPDILNWLVANEIRGKKLIEFFQNESTASGRGYHLGVTTILNWIDGKKHRPENLKITEML